MNFNFLVDELEMPTLAVSPSLDKETFHGSEASPLTCAPSDVLLDPTPLQRVSISSETSRTHFELGLLYLPNCGVFPDFELENYHLPQIVGQQPTIYPINTLSDKPLHEAMNNGFPVTFDKQEPVDLETQDTTTDITLHHFQQLHAQTPLQQDNTLLPLKELSSTPSTMLVSHQSVMNEQHDQTGRLMEHTLDLGSGLNYRFWSGYQKTNRPGGGSTLSQPSIEQVPKERRRVILKQILPRPILPRAPRLPREETPTPYLNFVLPVEVDSYQRGLPPQGNDLSMSTLDPTIITLLECPPPAPFFNNPLPAPILPPADRLPSGKLICPMCNEYPDGFRGEHELRRHRERCHSSVRRGYVVTDPSFVPRSAMHPTDPEFNKTPHIPPNSILSNCIPCSMGRRYNTSYNATSHLRRVHFVPAKEPKARRERPKKGEMPEGVAKKPKPRREERLTVGRPGLTFLQRWTKLVHWNAEEEVLRPPPRLMPQPRVVIDLDEAMQVSTQSQEDEDSLSPSLQGVEQSLSAPVRGYEYSLPRPVLGNQTALLSSNQDLEQPLLPPLLPPSSALTPSIEPQPIDEAALRVYLLQHIAEVCAERES